MDTIHRDPLQHRNFARVLINSENCNRIVAIEQIVQVLAVTGNTEALAAVGLLTFRQTVNFIDEYQIALFIISESGNHHFSVTAMLMIYEEIRFGRMEGTVPGFAQGSIRQST